MRLNLLPTCFLLFAALQQEHDKPLPEQTSFMEEVRKNLHGPDKLLSRYTYTEKETEITLDSKGKIKKTETNVYHVFNGAEEWQTYERQLSKNGVPLTQKELEKQDHKEKERVDKETRKRASWSEAKRQQEKAKTEREERELADDIFATFEYQLIRREMINGVSTILVNFKPKKNYKPKTGDAKELQHVAGRVWIAEDDHEFVKLEAEVIDQIKIGAGLLAKLQKGSTLGIELRKINDEIWLPAKFEMSLNGRLLLLKGLNMRIIVEFSEHKKFNVDTILDFREIP
jgi:uncharacterized protein YaiL (DUF2058 family)